MKVTKSTSWFTRFAKWTSRVSGSPAAFALAISIVVVWAVTGLEICREYKKIAESARSDS
ncbi:MAG: low affinity iron permease family protein [Burkholderiales bacterium]